VRRHNSTRATVRDDPNGASEMLSRTHSRGRAADLNRRIYSDNITIVHKPGVQVGGTHPPHLLLWRLRGELVRRLGLAGPDDFRDWMIREAGPEP